MRRTSLLKLKTRFFLLLLPSWICGVAYDCHSAEKARVSAPHATVYRSNSELSGQMAQVQNGQELTVGNRSFQGWIRVVAPGTGPAKDRIGWMKTQDLDLPASIQGSRPEAVQAPRPRTERRQQPQERPVENPNWLALFLDMAMIFPTDLQRASGYSTGYAIVSNYGLEAGRKLSPEFGLSLRAERVSFKLQGFGASANFVGAHAHYVLSRDPKDESYFLCAALGAGLLVGGQLSADNSLGVSQLSESFSSWYIMPRIITGLQISSSFFFFAELFYRYVADQSVRIVNTTLLSQLSGGALGVGLRVEF